MQLNEYTDQQLATFIRHYEEAGKSDGGKFSLSELRLEKQRRVLSPFSPRQTAQEILSLARSSSDGLVTYKEIWQRFRPGEAWKGNASQTEIARALASVIAFCVDNDLPVLTALVVRSGSRAHARDAVLNIYNEAKGLGIEVGLDPQAFVNREQEAARALSPDRLDAGKAD